MGIINNINNQDKHVDKIIIAIDTYSVSKLLIDNHIDPITIVSCIEKQLNEFFPHFIPETNTIHSMYVTTTRNARYYRRIKIPLEIENVIYTKFKQLWNVITDEHLYRTNVELIYRITIKPDKSGYIPYVIISMYPIKK